MAEAQQATRGAQEPQGKEMRVVTPLVVTLQAEVVEVRAQPEQQPFLMEGMEV